MHFKMHQCVCAIYFVPLQIVHNSWLRENNWDVDGKLCFKESDVMREKCKVRTELIVTQWRHFASSNSVNIGSAKGPILGQLMACSPTAPRLYLNHFNFSLVSFSRIYRGKISVMLLKLLSYLRKGHWVDSVGYGHAQGRHWSELLFTKR